jgi:hypothetical protein
MNSVHLNMEEGHAIRFPFRSPWGTDEEANEEAKRGELGMESRCITGNR